MLNDLLPGIVAIAFIAGAFLYGWFSDARRIDALTRPAEETLGLPATLLVDELEPS